MKFDKTKKIETIEDVKAFFEFLSKELIISFHPDDGFDSYIDENGNQLLSDDDCALYDTKMNECFDVCDTFNEDIYELAFDALVGK